MNFSICPQCGLPRDSVEVGNRICPLCGWNPFAVEPAVLAVPPTATPIPAVPDVQSRSVDPAPRRLVFPIVIVLVAVVAGAIAGIVYTRRSANDSSANTTTSDVGTADPVAVESETAAAKSNHLPPHSKPVGFADDRKSIIVSQPPAIEEKELAPEPRMVVDAPTPPPGPKVGEVVIQGDVERINMPQGEFVIDSLNDETRRVLRGDVMTLRLGSIGGKVAIDASGLRAKKIIVNGSVEGEGVVKLFAPDGLVEIRGKIDGNGRIEIDAPGGTVRFVEPTAPGQEGSKIDGGAKVAVTARTVEFHGKIDGAGQLKIDATDGTVLFAEPSEGGREGSKIGGGARVEIDAREVEFRGRIDGGAEVRIRIGKAGKIRYREIDGGAKLFYRTSKDGDPEPIIEAGELKGGAEVKKIP